MKKKYSRVRDDLPIHYRYKDNQNDLGEVSVVMEKWIPIDETEKTYLVVPEIVVLDGDLICNIKPKRVLKDSNKRYCYPSKKEALNSFILRKEWQIKHAKRSIKRAEAALVKSNNYEDPILLKIDN